MSELVKHYFDYKSPYAYLAQAASFRLAAQADVRMDWLPYTLQIPKYLGNAKLNEQGEDVEGTRNDHQWRRVRYAYMDCRREASRRGLIVRGPRHIFDSSIAHIAFLWLRNKPQWTQFHNAVFERFWRRELDIENVDVVLALMREFGIETAGFHEFLEGEGRMQHDTIQRDAEHAGVFGVCSWLIGDDLFWGLEKLPRVYERLGLKIPPEDHNNFIPQAISA